MTTVTTPPPRTKATPKHRGPRLTDAQVVRMRERFAAGESIAALQQDSASHPLRRQHVSDIVIGIWHRDAGGPICVPEPDRPAVPDRRVKYDALAPRNDTPILSEHQRRSVQPHAFSGTPTGHQMSGSPHPLRRSRHAR